MDFIDKYLSNGMTLMVVTLLTLAIAYRYYSAFIAAKMLALDDHRITPAHTLNDGQNYHPTNKWVLFGHHFAAIAGAGPLIGPVLAAQFGYLPGFLWILIGVCLAGAVQDFTILVFSIRRKGKSLAQLAFLEAGPVAGTAATIGILFVLVIAIAGLGKVVTKTLGGELITYPAGTQFVAPVAGGFTKPREAGNITTYALPAGTTIIYPTGTQETTGTRLQIESHPTNVDLLVDIDTMVRGVTGKRLVVPADNETTRKIAGSAWGTFSIMLTIPIALFVGWYIYRFRKGRVLEASIIGGILMLVAVYLGGMMDGATLSGGMDASLLAGFLTSCRDSFDLSEHQVGISIAVYGFIASILPVWLLLCPRDYLSSFLKIGTVLLLVVGVIIAHPHLHAPPINYAFIHGGPAFKGSLFPFVFIVIMCGAISGFHSLVASGTTPKMIDKESDARTIGFGAMLIEGLVGILALIAAAGMPTSDYFYIQTSIKDRPQYEQQIAQLAARDQAKQAPEKMSEMVGDDVQGRTGGAVTLAVGMAKIFDDAAKNVLKLTSASLNTLSGLMKYWYHFAIMFEALFILTTIDTGTRVGRFLIQETMGKWVHPSLGKTSSWPSALIATALMVGGWWYFLEANAMGAIWPMFGIANQMLAVMALAVASVALVHAGKKKYVLVTVLPMCFVIVTTTTAAYLMVHDFILKMNTAGISSADWTNALVASICILAITICTALVVISSFLAAGRPGTPEEPVLEEVVATGSPV